MLFLFMFLLTSFNAKYYSYHRNMIRNIGLRLIIACNYKRHKNAIELLKQQFQENNIRMQENIKIKKTELTNYYYYTLSDEDRKLFEMMVDMIL